MLESLLNKVADLTPILKRTSAKDCFCTAHALLTVTYPFYFIFSTSSSSLLLLLRSSRPEVLYKKGVLRNFVKFTGKHLC